MCVLTGYRLCFRWHHSHYACFHLYERMRQVKPVLLHEQLSYLWLTTPNRWCKESERGKTALLYLALQSWGCQWSCSALQPWCSVWSVSLIMIIWLCVFTESTANVNYILYKKRFHFLKMWKKHWVSNAFCESHHRKSFS